VKDTCETISAFSFFNPHPIILMSVKRIQRSRNRVYESSFQCTTWIFVLNNYTFQELIFLSESVHPSDARVIASIAWSEEIGGKKNIPHLQGFLQTYKKGKFLTYLFLFLETWSVHFFFFLILCLKF